MKMAEQQMILLSEVKKKITEDLEKSEDYDRLTLSKKSKELLGVITATYSTFPLILDDNISDKLTLEQYQAIYKVLAKSAMQGINFVRTARTMLGLPAEPQPRETPKEVMAKPTTVGQIRDQAMKVAGIRKDEPWVE